MPKIKEIRNRIKEIQNTVKEIQNMVKSNMEKDQIMKHD